MAEKSSPEPPKMAHRGDCQNDPRDGRHPNPASGPAPESHPRAALSEPAQHGSNFTRATRDSVDLSSKPAAKDGHRPRPACAKAKLAGAMLIADPLIIAFESYHDLKEGQRNLQNLQAIPVFRQRHNQSKKDDNTIIKLRDNISHLEQELTYHLLSVAKFFSKVPTSSISKSTALSAECAVLLKAFPEYQQVTDSVSSAVKCRLSEYHVRLLEWQAIARWRAGLVHVRSDLNPLELEICNDKVLMTRIALDVARDRLVAIKMRLERSRRKELKKGMEILEITCRDLMNAGVPVRLDQQGRSVSQRRSPG